MYSRPEPVKNIVLVGRIGNGKSATGNSLARREVFHSHSQAVGVTMNCQTYRVATKNGPILNVIDTPGLFDLMVSSEFISNEIVRCLALAEEGIHAVVLVLSARSRFSKEEEDTLCTLQALFGSKILDYLIVLFTGGDELENNQRTLDQYLSEPPEFLENVFRLCDNRRVLFNNTTKDKDKKEKQIENFLEKVAEIEVNNRRVPFTDERHREIKTETNKFKELQRDAEARVHAIGELEIIKNQLQMSYDLRLREMAQTVESTLRDAWNMQQEINMLLPGTSSNRKQVVKLKDKNPCNIL